jgi:hypothetical protein
MHGQRVVTDFDVKLAGDSPEEGLMLSGSGGVGPKSSFGK